MGSDPPLNAGALTQTAGRYYRYQFIKQVSNWPDYINPGAPSDIRLRYYTENATAGIFYLDYVRITLGSVTSAGESSAVSWGTDYFNDKTATADLDSTLVPSISANMNNAWFINSVVDNARITDSMASVAAYLDLSAERPAGSLVTGIRWAARYQSGATTLSLQARARDTSGRYAVLTNSQYTGWTGGTVANPGLATTTADASLVAAVGQTYISGVYQNNPDDIIDTLNHKIRFALQTSASTTVAEQVLVWDMAFVSLRTVGLNTSPNPPSTLKQYKTDDTEIVSAGWTNETSVKYKATVSDPDGDQVKICVEKQPLATPFTNAEDGCGALVASGATAEYTIGPQADNTEYHWQARTQDSKGSYSTWVAFGGAPRDYGTDTTAPTGGIVSDAVNTGLLNVLEASWLEDPPNPGGFDAGVSGLLKYEYAVRRGSDDRYWIPGSSSWEVADIGAWVDNGINTTATVNNIYLNTSERYYFSVKCYDNAGNVEAPVLSTGEQVLPMISYIIDNNTVTLDHLNASNNYTDDTKTSKIKTSTNAYSGYTVKASTTQVMTGVNYLETIDNFVGIWALPLDWNPGTYGFGYTSNDPVVQSWNRFANGTKFAGFWDPPPDNIVADHETPVTGQTGAVSDEEWTIRYKIATTNVQTADTYQTFVTYIVTANY